MAIPCCVCSLYVLTSTCHVRDLVGVSFVPRMERGAIWEPIFRHSPKPPLECATLLPGYSPHRHPAIAFQFAVRCAAVRHASACAVRVGLCAPLVPITDAPKIPRFGTSWAKPKRLTTLVARLSPIRVPPYACVDGPMVPVGPFSTAMAPASMNHCAILSWMKAPTRFSLSL